MTFAESGDEVKHFFLIVYELSFCIPRLCVYFLYKLLNSGYFECLCLEIKDEIFHSSLRIFSKE